MGFFGARFGATRYEADEFYRIALDFFNKNNLEEAINNITAAIELFPKRADYHATRGLFRLEDGLPDLAAPDFEMALRLHPYNMLGNYGMGAIAFGQEEYEAALDYFTKAWAVKQDRPETLYYLALTAHRLRNNAKAMEWMREAAKLLEPLAEKDKEARTHKRNADKWIREFSKLV